MSLDRLLAQAAKAGGKELRLVPGRRIVVVTPAGEREVQGPHQTAEAISQLLDGVLTDAARRTLKAGRAEWDIDVAAIGELRQPSCKARILSFESKSWISRIWPAVISRSS